MGRNLLSEPSKTGQIPRLRPTVPGPALAENPLENVADPNRVRCGVASEKPASTRILGAQTSERLTAPPHVNNFTQNSSCKPENISWPRTKPTCCCCRPCGRVGRAGA